MNTVVIRNTATGEAPTILEFSQPHFTKRQYNIVLSEMFFLAAQSIDNRDLSAEINGKNRVQMVTHVDGSVIWANVFVNGDYVRSMTIAD